MFEQTKMFPFKYLQDESYVGIYGKFFFFCNLCPSFCISFLLFQKTVQLSNERSHYKPISYLHCPAATCTNVFKPHLKVTHPWSFPLYPSGFRRSRSEFVKAQSFRCGWECGIAEELTSAQTLASERLKVLVQVFHSVGIRAEARRQCPLFGECGCHSWHFLQ